MKLKEIPPYLRNRFKLSILSAKKLNQRNPETELPVIVTLTTIPSRIKIVHLAVRSILAQEYRPKKIVLWLHESYENNLPHTLSRLKGAIFEIQYSPYTFSHRKLIHSLERFPEEKLVTIDDDMMYPPEFLYKLYKAHLKFPTAVMTHYARMISYNKKGKPLPYLQWPYIGKNPKNPKFVMPVGVFGVLYPPNVLDKRATDVGLINKLSPKSDDLWFKTMSLLKGTISKLSEDRPSKSILILGTQRDALKRTNNEKDYKRKQWEQIMDYFNITSER
ncbi:glycosyl transferase [Jejudonia soesokkakensis]|uniref:Glycosyl transferase n=1 Tax=Jejudonia soesokkakensis TaxID=1323432 RepID=A0ABW2MTA1_9FLAO